MRMIVIGNGFIEQSRGGRNWVDHHTGNFLLGLQGRETLFVDFLMVREQGFFQDFDLKENSCTHFGVRRFGIGRIFDLLRLIWTCFHAKFVFLYFPGSLSRLVGNVCRLFGVKYGVYVRGTVFDSRGQDAAILRAAAFVCAVSPELERRIHDCDQQHVHLVRPMCDIELHQLAYKQLTNAPDKWNLLFVGRIERAKGVFELIEASKCLRDCGVVFQLRIIGDGPDRQVLQNIVQELGLSDCVFLPGQQEDFSLLRQEYVGANAFIFPTHHEGFPRVLFEAMSCSLPIFTTMVGGIPGVMKPGVNCYEIPVNNGVGVSNEIERRLQNVVELNNVAQRGLEDVKEVLTVRPKLQDVLLRCTSELK